MNANMPRKGVDTGAAAWKVGHNGGMRRSGNTVKAAHVFR